MDTAKWPKALPPLTPELRAVSDDFMRRWHEVLPSRYGMIERFNHGFPVRHSSKTFVTTLEIGAGLGEHLQYERLTPEQEENYHALELRENMAEKIRQRYPRIQVDVGDCQGRLAFDDGYFDRIIAIHVLEHLPNLPACIREARRILHPERGQFLVVIPCEGSPAYSFARRISSQRMFEKAYGIPYSNFISREHINLPREIVRELEPHFSIEKRCFYPLRFLPWVFNNLCLGLVLKPKKT